MPRDPRYWEQVVLSEDNDWSWSLALVSGINGNITEPRHPSTPFAYRIEDKRDETAVFCATVTVRNERNGQPLLQPHSSAIVPLCSFASTSILPKLHSLPDMRLLVIEPPRSPVVYTRHKIRILNNIRHFLGFFGMLTDKHTYHSRSARLSGEYMETLPMLYGHTLQSIVLPLDFRESLDDVLQNLFQHHGLCNIEFTPPTALSSANIHASVLASYICPSLQSLQSLRKVAVPETLVCAELLNTFSTLLNLAEMRINPSASGHGGLRLVELILVGQKSEGRHVILRGCP